MKKEIFKNLFNRVAITSLNKDGLLAIIEHCAASIGDSKVMDYLVVGPDKKVINPDVISYYVRKNYSFRDVAITSFYYDGLSERIYFNFTYSKDVYVRNEDSNPNGYDYSFTSNPEHMVKKTRTTESNDDMYLYDYERCESDYRYEMSKSVANKENDATPVEE